MDNREKHLLSDIYKGQRQRSKRREHPYPSYSKVELREWMEEQLRYPELMKNWIDSDFETDLKPSVDRLRFDEPYTMENIQLGTWKENRDNHYDDQRSGVDNRQSRGVSQYKDGVKIFNFPSARIAERETGARCAHIGACCRGDRKSAGGFQWKFEDKFIEVNNLWNEVFGWSDYKKGAEYSVSDILGEPLQIKLKKKYPNQDDVKTREKTASWVGSAIHSQVETIMAQYTNVESETKVKFKNLSGTIDLVINQQTIADIKTGGESTIKQKIKKPEPWVVQLSCYRYLYYKQFGIELDDAGIIYWYTTDSKKYGVLEIKLMTLKETVAMIKEFMVQMEIPIEDESKCKSCSWLAPWCPIRSLCSFYLEDDMTGIEEW